MTSQYGAGWASRGDLPDEAYTIELVFGQWLSDLLAHIENIATPSAKGPQAGQRVYQVDPVSAPIPV